MNIIKLPDAKTAPKSKRSVTDTLVITQEEVERWRIPPFQRPLRINDKVKAMAEELKENGGVLAGVLTLGNIGSDKTTWLVDGQHRIGAFKISALKEAYAADKEYNDWLLGRNLSERDRRPAYSRIKAIFARRLREEGKQQHELKFPQPAWASS